MANTKKPSENSRFSSVLGTGGSIIDPGPSRGLSGNNMEGVNLVGDEVQFEVYDNSGVSVEYWNHSSTFSMHRHNYYEMALVTLGTCNHYYRGTTAPLVPGDIYIINPGEKHGYEIRGRINLINCQFLEGGAANAHFHEDTKSRWDNLLDNLSLHDNQLRGNRAGENTFLDTQGIIHLDADEFIQIKTMLLEILLEQNERAYGFENAKLARLQLLLIYLQRVLEKQNKVLEQYSNAKQDIVYDALSYIDQHLDEKIDFDQMAAEFYISPSYFRKLFRDMTGMPPLNYQNHRRIIKAMEYLTSGKYSIVDAAADVGIYDANYFSRLFKKIMGYAPRDYVKQVRGLKE